MPPLSSSSKLMRKLSPFPVDEKTSKILWRDFLFLVLGSVALSIISYVETHAQDVDARGMNNNYTEGSNSDDAIYKNPMGIVDTGFIITAGLHSILKKNQYLVDVLAGINSVALVIPSIYTAYITIWIGDYSLTFRIIATQLLRSFCGWFTFLPPDPSYLTSFYDFPDIAQCLFQDCSGAPKALPFVSFFSGHVATLVITGNHMWLRKFTKLSILMHALNAFQIVRLLATRGHYSIDIIIGWYMAIYVSNGAARLGRYYSRGHTSLKEFMPANATDAFETFTGVSVSRQEAQMSTLMRREDVQKFLSTLKEEELNDDSQEGETTARIIHERVYELQEQMNERVNELQQQMQARVEEMQREFSAYRAEKVKEN